MANNLTSTAQCDPDEELVVLAKQGRQAAFATFFQAHKKEVYSLCLRMTSNPEKAEYFTQEAFLQMFRRLGTYRGEIALSTWLYRLAVAVVLTQARSRRTTGFLETAGEKAGIGNWVGTPASGPAAQITD